MSRSRSAPGQTPAMPRSRPKSQCGRSQAYDASSERLWSPLAKMSSAFKLPTNRYGWGCPQIADCRLQIADSRILDWRLPIWINDCRLDWRLPIGLAIADWIGDCRLDWPIAVWIGRLPIALPIGNRARRRSHTRQPNLRFQSTLQIVNGQSKSSIDNRQSAIGN